jgi:hypothetical protein
VANAQPDLKTTHDRLLAVDRYLLEVLARTQAVGSASVVMSVATLQQMALQLTQSVMDLEAWTQPATT